MKIGTNMILLGVLSMLIGTAFASPLLVSELEIRPYVPPLPKGPTADLSVSVVYANYSVGDSSLFYTKNVTDISYFVVLNITNNSDEWAVVNSVNFDAAEEITEGVSFFSKNNSTIVSGWEAKGAWVDGEWFNVTWVPYPNFDNAPDDGGPKDYANEGYWMEGVQLRATYVGGELAAIHMNMNGTWTDVTGRIEGYDEEAPHFNGVVTVERLFFSEMKFLGQANISPPSGILVTRDMEIIETNESFHAGITTNVTEGFSNLWAPHQSRLIALSTSRRVTSELVEPSKLALLETGPIAFRLSVHHQLNGTIGVYDSTSVAYELKQVQLELTENGYLYNVILADDEMFVMDSFGVEAFIEPRN